MASWSLHAVFSGAAGFDGAPRAAPDDSGGGATATEAGPADADLIARIAARDRAAFAALFERYAGKIKAYLIRSGAAHDAAEEAAQEAMLSIWRRAETFDHTRASATAWIFAIARNKRVDLIRRGARPEPDPMDPSFRPDPEPSAERAVSTGRRDEMVRAALEELSAEQREVVALSFYEGLAHADIAERLGAPLGTVKSRLRLAFGKMRRALGDDFQQEIEED